jgi:stage V sporulation protein G
VQVTDIRMKRIGGEGKVKAFCSITLGNQFVVHEVKVINGANGLFVAMPSKRMGDGEFRDLMHPLTAEAREALQKTVLEAYVACEEAAAAFPAPVGAAQSADAQATSPQVTEDTVETRVAEAHGAGT